MRRVSTLSTALLVLACTFTAPSIVRAQAPADDDPAVLRLAEPDFTLIGLPTSLRLPTFGSSFRVTHRFTRPLGQGDFGDLASDFFGIDSGAQIGLEYRFGLVKNGQVVFHYKGKDPKALEGVTVENARWMGDLLGRLSDKQLADAFRAGGFTDAEIITYVKATRGRINQLKNLK